jgi:DNA-binding transcriptional regulator YiaG
MLLSQKDLADLLNVSVTTVSNWETGKKQPTLRHQRYLKAILEPRRSRTKKTVS